MANFGRYMEKFGRFWLYLLATIALFSASAWFLFPKDLHYKISNLLYSNQYVDSQFPAYEQHRALFLRAYFAGHCVDVDRANPSFGIF